MTWRRSDFKDDVKGDVFESELSGMEMTYRPEWERSNYLERQKPMEHDRFAEMWLTASAN
jgi:hypothetical protein